MKNQQRKRRADDIIPPDGKSQPEIKPGVHNVQLAQPAVTLSRLIFGYGLSASTIAVFVTLLIAQVFINFKIFSNKPVPGTAAAFYKPESGYQNIDVPVWINTGAMLPYNAPAVRSMRPLYPAALMVARWVGLYEVNPLALKVPPGQNPSLPVGGRKSAVHILLAFNCVMTVVSLWIFFCLCRRFGMKDTSAAMASLVAGAGFGFSFWVTQAVPEVFGYFAVVVSLAAIVIGFEKDRSVNTIGTVRGLGREFMAWGLVGFLAGVLLLGKEIYSIPIFGGLLLLFTRRWAGLPAFCIAILLPTICWNYYMSRIVGAFDPAAYLKEYRFVIWLFQDLPPLSWSGRFAVLWGNLTTQLQSFVRAFAYVPVGFAVIGVIACKSLPRQNLLLAAFFASIYILFLASNFVYPRLMFMTWPVVFFFCWQGVEYIVAALDAKLGSGSGFAVYLKGGILLGLMILGTRQQFAWYFYG